MTTSRTLGEAVTPRRLRSMRETERAILEAIRRKPDQSRAELAASLRLSPALLSGTVGTFIEEGWITERRQRVPSRRGQPALRLRLRKAAIAGIGISLSTGGIEVAAIDLAGNLLASTTHPIGAQDFEAGAAALRRAVDSLLGLADCWVGISISVPALVGDDGEIEEITPSQRGVDFAGYKRALEAWFKLPVGLESKCPAIEEAMFGSQPDAVIFMLFLDYGIGGSLIDELRVYRGGFRQAVNIGALMPDTGPRPSVPDLARYLGLSGKEPGPEVFAALSQVPKERLADWIRSRGQVLSDPLSIIVQLLNPTEIVLSGILPRPVIEGLAAQVELDRFDAPGRVPIGKPNLRIARNVGEGSTAISAAAVSIYRALSDPDTSGLWARK